MKSPGTFIGGGVTAAGAALMGCGTMDWLTASEKHGFMLLGFVLTIVGPLLLGLMSASHGHVDDKIAQTETTFLRRDQPSSEAPTTISSPPPKSSPPSAKITLLAALCILMATGCTGCAHFNSTVTDIGTNGVSRVTKMTAYTLFDGSSSLANFKASQSHADAQAVSVGSLAQTSSATNFNAMLESVVGAAVKAGMGK